MGGVLGFPLRRRPPLSEGVARDLAVREYKQHLMLSGSTSSTVNSHLSAIDNLYMFVGLGPAGAKRQELPALAPCSRSRRA